MQIDVKPLVWTEAPDGMRSGVYRIQIETYGQGLPFWSYGSTIMRRDSDPEVLCDLANSHHAAHVRSQVAGVRLSDDEARELADDVTTEFDAPFDAFHWETQNAMVAAAKAAIAAMQVDTAPAPDGADPATLGNGE